MLVACHFSMHYVYILRSFKDKGLYIGLTSNLKKRFKEHQNGKSLSTKGRAPFELIHYQAFNNKKDAIATEKYLKTTRGWERIHRMLENTIK
jgi:putative endonuclease